MSPSEMSRRRSACERDGEFVEQVGEIRADKAVGLDGALTKVAHASYGPVLLGIVAAGLIGFAAYSIVDARYRKV